VKRVRRRALPATRPATADSLKSTHRLPPLDGWAGPSCAAMTAKARPHARGAAPRGRVFVTRCVVFCVFANAKAE
jgi:hypothetical protein